MKLNKNLCLGTLGMLAAVALLASCSKGNKSHNSPLVLGDVKSEVLSSDKKSAHGRRDALAIRSELVLSKEAILGREFLYGSDLQYSTKSDEEYGLVLQTVSVG